jgi:branched-chain amino acid transport system ATP-binding protein
MSSALLELDGLEAGYDGIAVVHGLDLRVGEGEVVALLGPNGAGKTTALRTVAGLLPRLAGRLRVLGEDVPIGSRSSTRTALRLVRRGLGYVPENRALFGELTTSENVRLGARRKDRAAVEEALDTFPQLQPLVDRRAGLLSGGEQQMLALARALARRPRLLLVDEMSLGLAPLVVRQLLPVVRSIAEDTGAGVLLVEQHVPAALEVAARAYVLQRGRVTIEGPSAELQGRRDLFASSYLGT